ncbi:hypothetical protein CerSpe_294980 [Prunus speciosa]
MVPQLYPSPSVKFVTFFVKNEGKFGNSSTTLPFLNNPPLPPSGPPRCFPGPPVDPPLGRSLNGGYRSPPRGWARDGPRDFGAGMPPPRHEGRFPDHQMRRDRLDYSDNHRGRTKFDRLDSSPPKDYNRPMYMDRGRDDRCGMGQGRIGSTHAFLLHSRLKKMGHGSNFRSSDFLLFSL